MAQKRMVIYNAATRELTAKIVYYGPGLGGKTTNLQLLHERLEPGTVGKLLNLATQTDRTIYFDLLPVELGDIKGYKIRFQLATVPGQTAFNETRRVVLKGADGIVFVADSQWTMLPKNLESWQNLKDNLKANGVSFEGIPIVIQYNKRDLSDVLSVDALQEALGLSSYPFVEAVASAGRGVTETFKLISKLTFVDLLRRLQGRRPGEPPAASAAPVRRENDDLLSWKDSLLNRAAASDSATTKRLSLVPAPPAEEPPFATEEEPFSPAAEPGAPFGDLGPSAPEAVAESGPEPAPASSSAPEPLPAAAQEAATAATERPIPPHEPDERGPSVQPLEIELSEELASPAPLSVESVTPMSGMAFAALEDRVARLEDGLADVIAGLERAGERSEMLSRSVEALTARYEAFERDARALGKSLLERQEASIARLETLERSAEMAPKEAETRLKGVEERLASSEKRLRISEDDVSMALRSLGERNEKLHQQLESLVEQIEVVSGALAEKTGQSRREADDIRAQISSLESAVDERVGHARRESEDIRTQIAPLLEGDGRRREADERMAREFERLRESLAEGLGELSERVRRAVRDL